MSVEEESSMQTEAAVLQVAAKEAATGKRLLLKVYDIKYFVILHICFIMFCVIRICRLIYHLSSSVGFLVYSVAVLSNYSYCVK